jgi:uncharacterized membrane protein
MEEMNNVGSRHPEGSVPVNNVGGETRTPVERMADTAREQATQAADALRRGEFMHESTVDTTATPDDRLIALLSYLTQVFIPLVMPIIVLLSESSKTRPFQRYHAVQSLGLAVLFGAAILALSMSSAVLWIVPIVGWVVSALAACLIPIVWAMGVISMLYYGYQAYQGKRFAIPGLTTFMRDQGWI